jgi:hypothetical protein
LKEKFIPVAGNTHELQNGRTPARDWFIGAAAKVKPGVTSGQTAQGFYVIAPDGKAFGTNNNRSVERVKAYMLSGLEQYAKHEMGPLEITEGSAEYVRKPDASTSVIRVYTRIRPVPQGSDASNENVAQDHLWITKPEIEGILAGNQFANSTIYRLARFNLIDNVRGEPDHWKPGEIKTAILDLKRQIEAGGYVTYALTGRFEMATADNSRGLTVKLNGRLTIAKEAARVHELKVYGEGEAWGKSTYTPNPPPGVFPIVFALVQADDPVAKVVAPQAIFFGREYFDPKR